MFQRLTTFYIHNQNRLVNVLLAAVLAGLLGLWLYIASHQPELLLNDSYRAFARAQSLMQHPTQWRLWVDDYYPVGYPLLIGLLTEAIGSAHTAAKVLTLAGSASIAFTLVYLLRKWADTPVQGTLTAAGVLLLLGTNFNFIQLGTNDNTDMPCAALMFAALALASTSERVNPKRIFWAGVVVGLAYLIRYTALTLLPVFVLFPLTFTALPWPQRFRQAGWVLAGFAAGTALQWVPSILLEGNPFYNKQVHNVHFALYGQSNWGQNWPLSQSYTSLGQVIGVSPSRFAGNIALNLYKIFAFNAFTFPVFLLVLPGMALLWLRNRPIGLLVGGSLAVFAGALSIAFVTPRTCLFLIPLFALLAGVALLPLSKQPLAAWVLLAALALVAGNQFFEARTFWRNPTAASQSPNHIIANVLTKAGMKSEKEVLSLGFSYYNPRHRYNLGYAMPWSFVGTSTPIPSAEALFQLIRSRGYRFIITDGESTKNVPGLSNFWPSLPSHLQVDTLFIQNSLCVMQIKK